MSEEFQTMLIYDPISNEEIEICKYKGISSSSFDFKKSFPKDTVCILIDKPIIIDKINNLKTYNIYFCKMNYKGSGFNEKYYAIINMRKHIIANVLDVEEKPLNTSFLKLDMDDKVEIAFMVGFENDGLLNVRYITYVYDRIKDYWFKPHDYML